MPSPIPTLGFPTRRAAFVALAMEGRNPAQIAARVNAAHAGAGLTARQVTTYLSVLRIKGRESVPMLLRLPVETFEQLMSEARSRNSRADYLARRLVEAAVSDNLINAILDDGGDA